MMKKAQQMVVFNALTHQRSFTKAAQLLDISRTQVSKQIQLLEERLGVQLVQRTTRSFALTEAGERFAVHCSNIVAEVNEAESELLQNTDTMQGVLRIGSAQSFARHHISPYIADFHQQYPQLDVEMSLFDHRVDLIAEQLDLWIGMTDTPPEGFVARHLADCHFVLAASPAYLAKFGVPYQPSELSEHNCIIYYSRERKDNIWSFRQGESSQDVKVKGNYKVDSADAILDATLSGHGIGYLATYLLDKEFQEGRLVRLLPDWQLSQYMPLYAIYPRYKFLPKKVQAFIDFTRDHIGEPVYWDKVLR